MAEVGCIRGENGCPLTKGVKLFVRKIPCIVISVSSIFMKVLLCTNLHIDRNRMITNCTLSLEGRLYSKVSLAGTGEELLYYVYLPKRCGVELFVANKNNSIPEIRSCPSLEHFLLD